jgi:ERCC4-type nuclease
MNMPPIIIDTREQTPYHFSSIDPIPETITATLKTGDYSLAGFENRIAIERKSAPDLFGSMGRGRVRFEKEFARLAVMEYACLMIEDDWINILQNPPVYSRMNRRSVFWTCQAWSVKYGVHVCWGHHRKLAEKLTYRLLSDFWKYHGREK